MMRRSGRRTTDGQALLEYIVLGAFIAIIVLAGASGLGGSIEGWFEAMAQTANKGGKKSNCSAQGMASSGGKCHGG